MQEAIPICCAGRTLKPADALRLGLVDGVALNAVNEAIAFGERVSKIHRTRDLTNKLGNIISNNIIYAMAKKKIVASVPSDMPAPLRALDAIYAATRLPFKEGLRYERKLFVELNATPAAAALKHVFFAERASSKVPGVDPEKLARPVKSIGVIGGGLMGCGIAINFLLIAMPVVIVEVDPARRDLCVKSITSDLQKRLAKKRLLQRDITLRLSKLRVVGEYEALREVDFVIEAVFEEMELKRRVFGQLDRVCPPHAVLASNTSTLSIDEIASAVKNPRRVIGAHFFSPAQIMKLVEFVRGSQTEAATIATALVLGKRIRKTCVVVNNCFGFVANRMILKSGFQALAMLEEGSQPYDVDRAVRTFGFPMGPFAMQDLAGLDVATKIQKGMPEHLVPKRDVTTVATALAEMGRLGLKSNAGWHSYTAKSRKPHRDITVERMVIACSKKKKLPRRYITDKEATERYTLALINEAAWIIQDGIVTRPSDIDIIFVYGFGFPPHKGGPCHYADTLGLQKVVDLITLYNTALEEPTFPSPCPLLLKLAKEGKCFADLKKD